MPPSSGRRRPAPGPRPSDGSRGRAPARARRPRRRWPRRLLALLVLPALLGVLALALVLLVVFVSEPLPTDEGDGARLLAADGTEFAQLTAEFVRRDVVLGALPQHTVDAVLAAEDAGFYTHPGISVPGVVRAIVSNVRSGEISQGGSTITQQYIKVVSRDDARTVWRKVREAALAFKLERTYSKDEILERYLNVVYFGRGAYGIQAAAQAYFGVDASQLTLAQSAVLAGVLPAPSRYDPGVDVQASHVRYRYVLGRMVDEGWLGAAERDALLVQQPPVVPRTASGRDDAPWFTGLVRQELDALGFADGRGLEVATTLDRRAQQLAEAAYLPAFTSTTATGALVAVSPQTGGVIAVVGGEDAQTDQLNLALARRQPGSTFKPFALAAWLAEGRSPDEVLDSPAQLTLPGADAGADWTVSNYGGASHGRITLREATWRSSNTAYAQVAAQVGPGRVAEVADALLSRSLAEALPANASLVLGSAEVTPVEMAGAYATLAAGGVRADAHTITEVRRDGEVLYRAPAPGPAVLEPDVAHAVSAILTGVVERGTGQSAVIGRPAAGKTGTTSDNADAWFAGYTPQVAAVVWMGNREDNSPLPGGETGGGLPASTWAAFMAAVHEGLEVVPFPEPDWSRFGVVADPGPTVVETETAAPTETTTATEAVTETTDPTPTPSPTAPTTAPTPRPTGDAPETRPPATDPPAPAPTSEPTPEPTPTPTAAATPPPPTADADPDG